MKNMKIKVISLLLVLVIGLTGCATSDNTLTIKPDGSANSKAVMTVEKDAVVTALMAKGYTKEEAESYVNMQAISVGAKKIEIDGKDAYQYTTTENYAKGENWYALSDYDDGYITGDTYYDIQDMTIDPDDTEMYKNYGVTDAALKNVKVTYSVVFANKIVNTNGKIDSQNPNKATFTLTIGKKNTVFATTKQGQTIAKVQKIIKAARTIKTPKIKKLKANKVKGNKATVTVKINKVKGAKRYVVEYDTNSKFRNSKTISTKKATVTLKKLKKNKKYYVRVYAIKKDDRGDYVFSKFSKKKSVKTKK